MRLFLWLGVALASNLVRINDKNFKSVVYDSGKYTLVDFYADWCRHCMKLMPTIEQVADLYADYDQVQIVKINGDTDGRKTTKKFNIPGFPSLLMFNGSDLLGEFDGSRDAESITNFIQQMTGVKLAAEEPEIEDFGVNNIIDVADDDFDQQVLRANRKTMVLFTTPSSTKHQEVSSVFNKLANKIYTLDSEVVQFAQVDLSDLNKAQVKKIISNFGITLAPMLLFFDPQKVHSDGLRRPTNYEGEFSVDSLVEFINEHAALKRNAEGLLTNGAGVISVFSEALQNIKEEEHAQALVEKVSDLSKKLEERSTLELIEEQLLGHNDDISMMPYYAKLSQKIILGNANFIKSELVRLQSLLATSAQHIAADAIDSIQKRINVLAEFTKHL